MPPQPKHTKLSCSGVRFLVFEYMFQYMLRKRQVEMSKDYLDKYHRNESSCQQMIMGVPGITGLVLTVLGLLGWEDDGDRAFALVVPS